MAVRDEFEEWGFDDPAQERTERIQKAKAANKVTFVAPTHDPETGQPHTKKRQADIVRQMKGEHAARETQAAGERRKAWEKSPEGRGDWTLENAHLPSQRRKDIRVLATEEYRRQLGERGMRTESGRVERRGIVGQTHAQLYGAFGITHEGHGYGDQQIPGLENPHAVTTPPRAETLSKEQMANADAGLAARGTSRKKMAQDFGAQMDQGYWRAHVSGNTTSTGTPVPFSKHFYDEGHPEDAPPPLDRPAEELRRIAHETGMPRALVVGATALTSPNTKFSQGARESRHYPNMATAQYVIHQHKEGVPSEEMEMGINSRTGRWTQGRPANLRRAGRMLEHVAGGGRMTEARNPPSRSSPEGSQMWSAPKVGPFANSFAPDIPDFLVPDVHTGGGGMFSHLSTDKPDYETSSGARAFDKSEREKAIAGVPHLHSVADAAAREAVAKRTGGTSVRQGQAVQWGEEQLQRGAEDARHYPTHALVYPGPQPVHNLNAEQFGEHQGSLF